MTMKQERVRALNDELRRSHRNGRILLTPGVLALGAELIRKIDSAVSAFDAFEVGDDPYEEHDFGAVTIGDHVVFFKIDYYDLDLLNGSPDPADPAVTCRVMTIMLADEY